MGEINFPYNISEVNPFREVIQLFVERKMNVYNKIKVSSNRTGEYEKKIFGQLIYDTPDVKNNETR